MIPELESVLGMSRTELLRQGLGFGSARTASSEREREYDDSDGVELTERQFMIPPDPNDPHRSQLIQEAIDSDRRLQRDLRLAGLI